MIDLIKHLTEDYGLTEDTLVEISFRAVVEDDSPDEQQELKNIYWKLETDAMLREMLGKES